MPKTGVYLIFCLENKRVYVGSAACVGGIKKRFNSHRATLRKNRHHSILLQRSWNKYGEDAFLFTPLEYIDEPTRCIEREQWWIDRLKPFFNICLIAGSPLGKKHSEEARKRMSLSHKGKKLSSEHIAKIIASRKGIKYSLESKLKMSAWQIGKKLSPEHIAKVVAANTGKKRSEESRFRMSLAQKEVNRKLTPEHKAKIAAAQKGRKHSPEHIAKVAAIHRGKIISKEIRAKISIAKTGAKNPRSKPILCIELDKKFESTGLAAKFLRETTINSKALNSSIGSCARGNGKYSHAYGFTWRYL
ncbi:MAG: GIY-YIG nuclease family protein [Melioribacteraceae bacterium]|nr:GIY-YIG nuclease family protein [Melioribacteraceae bacterium]